MHLDKLSFFTLLSVRRSKSDLKLPVSVCSKNMFMHTDGRPSRLERRILHSLSYIFLSYPFYTENIEQFHGNLAYFEEVHRYYRFNRIHVNKFSVCTPLSVRRSTSK